MQLQLLVEDGSAVLIGFGFALVFYAYVGRLEDRLGDERGGGAPAEAGGEFELEADPKLSSRRRRIGWRGARRVRAPQ